MVEIEYCTDHLGTDIRDLKGQPAFLLPDQDGKPRSFDLKDPVSKSASSSPQSNHPCSLNLCQSNP